MKKCTWDNDNKMHFESGHKEFNRQTNIISTGNIYASTETGSYVRCWNDKGRDLVDNHDGSHDRGPGQLFKFDMKNFPDMRADIYNWVETLVQSRDKSIIVYEFFHYNGKRKIIHGYIVADNDNQFIRSFVTGPTVKSYNVIIECKPYVCQEEK